MCWVLSRPRPAPFIKCGVWRGWEEYPVILLVTGGGWPCSQCCPDCLDWSPSCHWVVCAVYLFTQCKEILSLSPHLILHQSFHSGPSSKQQYLSLSLFFFKKFFLICFSSNCYSLVPGVESKAWACLWQDVCQSGILAWWLSEIKKITRKWKFVVFWTLEFKVQEWLLLWFFLS